MALLTECWLLDALSVFTALVVIFIAWVKWSQSYWSRKGLTTPPTTFFLGNVKDVLSQKQSLGSLMEELYKYFKSRGKEHGGFYFLCMPNYVPLDPEIIKHMIQNDFEHFVSRGLHYHEDDPLSGHLFSLDGAKWKNMRVKLTPTFTSGKMKMMFDTLCKCGDQLVVEMDKNAGKVPVDIKDILQRFTTDIIGSCGFGLDCNALKDPNSEFTKTFQLFFVEGFWANLISLLIFVAPDFANTFSIKVIPPKLTDFFMKIVKDTVHYREQNNVHRKDFMHLLLQLKNRGKLSDDGSVLRESTDDKNKDVSLTMDELAAQAFVFWAAGYETSSTTMTFCLFELASNPDIQEKLRKEICSVLERHDNNLTYDAIMEMHYLDQVINETLRKYPPLPALNRMCTKTYKVPNTDIVIEKGTKVWIPVIGLQRDPEIYPNPEKFDPDRFSEENKRERHPYAFIPFGDGPRICLGMRFGQMQTKVGICILLKNYRFTVNSQTSVPLKLDPSCFVVTAKGGIWLNCTKI